MPWRYFTVKELRCRHCGLCVMDEAFMARLDLLRGALDTPLIISSGYRCPDHNTYVSTTGREGPHTTGHAVDIAVSGIIAFRLIAEAITLGFTGIGVQQKGGYASRFIHVDDLPMGPLRPRIWSY